MPLIVRPYRTDDREALRSLMCNTAIMGRPVDCQCTDREFIADTITRYYTDVIPEWSWVLVDTLEQRLVGYLTGSPETKKSLAMRDGRIMRQAVIAAWRRGSLWKRGSRRFLWRAGRDIIVDGALSAVGLRSVSGWCDERNPAHAHLNVLPGYQAGVGMLVRRFLAALKREKVVWVMGEIWAENVRMSRLLEKRGFALVHSSLMPGMRKRNGHRYRIATYLRPLVLQPGS